MGSYDILFLFDENENDYSAVLQCGGGSGVVCKTAGELY